MSSNAISAVKEMPRFHPLGVVKRDYLRAGASVSVACVLLLPVDTNWGHRFSHPRSSQGCQNSLSSEVGNAKQQECLLMQDAHARTQFPRPDSTGYRRNLHLPCVVQGSRACLSVECWEFHLQEQNSEPSPAAKSFPLLSISDSIASLRNNTSEEC